jgi:hypothetical protein
LRAAVSGERSDSTADDQLWQALLRAVEQIDRDKPGQSSLDAAYDQASTIERTLEALWNATKEIFGEHKANPGDKVAAH